MANNVSRDTGIVVPPDVLEACREVVQRFDVGNTHLEVVIDQNGAVVLQRRNIGKYLPNPEGQFSRLTTEMQRLVEGMVPPLEVPYYLRNNSEIKDLVWEIKSNSRVFISYNRHMNPPSAIFQLDRHRRYSNWEEFQELAGRAREQLSREIQEMTEQHDRDRQTFYLPEDTSRVSYIPLHLDDDVELPLNVDLEGDDDAITSYHFVGRYDSQIYVPGRPIRLLNSEVESGEVRQLGAMPEDWRELEQTPLSLLSAVRFQNAEFDFGQFDYIMHKSVLKKLMAFLQQPSRYDPFRIDFQYCGDRTIVLHHAVQEQLNNPHHNNFLCRQKLTEAVKHERSFYEVRRFRLGDSVLLIRSGIDAVQVPDEDLETLGMEQLQLQEEQQQPVEVLGIQVVRSGTGIPANGEAVEIRWTARNTFVGDGQQAESLHERAYPSMLLSNSSRLIVGVQHSNRADFRTVLSFGRQEVFDGSPWSRSQDGHGNNWGVLMQRLYYLLQVQIRGAIRAGLPDIRCGRIVHDGLSARLEVYLLANAPDLVPDGLF